MAWWPPAVSLPALSRPEVQVTEVPDMGKLDGFNDYADAQRVGVSSMNASIERPTLAMCPTPASQ